MTTYENYKAGYICDVISQIIKTHKSSLDNSQHKDQLKLDQINGLLQHVSSFDVHFPYRHAPNFNRLQPILATINNIITRGLPTRTPLILEQLFQKIELCTRDDKKYEFNFPNSKKTIKYDTIFDLLHIIEPHLTISKKQYGGDLGSAGEWFFLDETLKKFPFAKQILQSQRDFSTINKTVGGGRNVDFSFEFPYHNSDDPTLKKKGIIFEYDGPTHKIESFKYYDNYRDDAAEKEGFETLRQVSGKKMPDANIENKFRKKIFELFKKNYKKSIKEYLVEYSLIFIPLAVARIKKTLIEFLLVHEDFFEKKTIKIAIIERDLQCGAIAVKCLKDLLTNINELLEDKDKLPLPNIELTIFENSNWVTDKMLHLNAKLEDETYFKQHDFDIIIDHSILRRSNIYKESDFQHDQAIKIRSSHFVDNSYGKSRRVYCANLLNYKSLARKKDDGSYFAVAHLEKPIEYFIQNIFRKVSFREGQLPIISRALQQKPVVGLLPTGGGKSLTFQLSSFLQPGLCLVVDPIKSLMEDQVRVLKENWIDCCDYINSNLDRKAKNNKLIDFRYGETMFMFVSPERFVMEEFRTIIKNIDASNFGLAFAYCVIDEVHCVSEWGHDFRSTYLMLGKNAQDFTKTKQNNPVSLIGLTATASFDVLADIERELKIKHKDIANAIIMIENTIRPELFFRVIDVGSSDRVAELNQDFEKMGENLNKINKTEILTQSLAHHYIEFENKEYGQWNEHSKQYTLNRIGQKKIAKETEKLMIKYELKNKTQNDFYSIVFCTVKGKGGYNKKGVDWVYENLLSKSKGFYYASEDDDTEEFKKGIQKHFEDFTSDKTQHIVCTKAFGMGIDKDDIRSTYHFNYSSSLESLVQEAGRSGRDKKISEANILVSRNKFFKLNVYAFFRDNEDDELIKNPFIRKKIRKNFESEWNDKESKFQDITFETEKAIVAKIKLLKFNEKTNILEKNRNKYKYILEEYEDKATHNFFYKNSFKGADAEKSQFLNLFKIKDKKNSIEGQETLLDTFNNCHKDVFQFLITEKKEHANASERICELVKIKPNHIAPYYKKTNKEQIESSHKYANDFNDFLFQLEEKNVLKLPEIDNLTKRRLLFIYNRNRTKQDTGRLIYRMHSMGFLEDYTMDYNKRLLLCTFRKYPTIDEYVEHIDDYFKRYLSEKTALEKKLELKKRLHKHSLIENILECLYFLGEFFHKEIADKRKRATDEIESILNQSITEYSDNWFEQNKFVKEQIYFYFNAKYTRIGFKIQGKSYSLLDDYQSRNPNKPKILNRYLNCFGLEGTEQNDYKHMMGSCKKILRSLSETELENEWLLRLLKAFAMYAVNNSSYTSEANKELELGFKNLYKFYNNKFNIIEPIFTNYFSLLEKNIERKNKSFKDIKLIRLKLLLDLQTSGINEFLAISSIIK